MAIACFFEPLVVEVAEEVLELRSGEHPLVDERARRQAREIDRHGDSAERGVSDALDLAYVLDAVRDALAEHVRTTVEVDAAERLAARGHAGDEQLTEPRHHRPGHRTEVGAVRVDGQLSPADQREALVGDDLLDVELAASAAASASAGRNAMPVAYSPAGGRSKSTTARNRPSGTWTRMPAPSPVWPSSAPFAPR